MNETINAKVASFFDSYPIKAFAKGELVLFAGNSVPPVSYIVKGTVGQYDISDTGTKVTLTIFKPGAFFPMSCAVNETPNKYFYEALEPLQVRQASAENTTAFLRREPDVLFNLLQRLYRGTDSLLGRMSLLMSGSAASRVVYELLIAAERFGTRKNDGRYSVEITESQLASQTGLARETVSRELQKCVKRGDIQLERGRVFVRL